jgi:hypothetical protein
LEFQKMTNEQKLLNNSEFNVLIQNIRHINSGLADMMMWNRLMVDRHVTALEKEVSKMNCRTIKEVTAHG